MLKICEQRLSRQKRPLRRKIQKIRYKRLIGVELTGGNVGRLVARRHLPQGFRTTNYVRNWLPIRREQCAKARFTEEQMVAIIREADREPVSVVAKRHGISEQTIYTWRKRFGGFQASEVRRLKQLEAENARLKKLVAERDLEIEIMKEVAAKNW
jgi:putative transposase